MSMGSEFKDFIMKGNVMDLAVGVIIGAAFGKIIDSLVQDVIMPIIGSFGSVSFVDKFIALSPVPEGTAATLAAHKLAGVNTLNYGNFITILINFLILAFVIFQMVKMVNRLRNATPPVPPATPDDVVLLREIRDALKK
jgi:large conductance mechanosensitive channel